MYGKNNSLCDNVQTFYRRQSGGERNASVPRVRKLTEYRRTGIADTCEHVSFWRRDRYRHAVSVYGRRRRARTVRIRTCTVSTAYGGTRWPSHGECRKPNVGREKTRKKHIIRNFIWTRVKYAHPKSKCSSPIMSFYKNVSCLLYSDGHNATNFLKPIRRFTKNVH